MNIVKITDGIGNQMFQYAFARRLQMETGKAVYLDTRYLNNEDVIARGESHYQISKYTYRKYELDNFKIRLDIADESMLRHWDYLKNDKIFHQAIYALAKNRMWVFNYCNDSLNDVKIHTLMPMYYKGYFFDLKYYDSFREILQKEFVLKNKMHLPESLRGIIRNENIVSLHVRKGDFKQLHWDIRREDYYPKAMDFIKERVANPIYLIFSDDIEWVKENLQIDGEALYVSDMGFTDCQELAIMKHCRHNIIANSTFSYWAAYLNNNPNKIVICPRNWKTYIIPDGWVSL